jgi:hypothetical protein
MQNHAKLLEHISNSDFGEVLRYCSALTDEERYAAIEVLVKQTDETIDSYSTQKGGGGDLQEAFFYALLCCCRRKEDLKRVEKEIYNKCYTNPL